MKTFITPSVKPAVIHFFIPHSHSVPHSQPSIPYRIYHITSPDVVMTHKQKKEKEGPYLYRWK